MADPPSKRDVPSPRVLFGTNLTVTVIRDAGTPQEKQWTATVGGDLRHLLLFHWYETVKTGDTVYSELFDEPRVIVRVDPVLHPGLTHWEATIIPQSVSIQRPWVENRAAKSSPRPPEAESSDAAVDVPAKTERAETSNLRTNTSRPVDKLRDQGRKGMKSARQNARYKSIDEALRKIAESRPSTQEAIFQSLEDRCVVFALAEPFLSVRGWIAGFRRDTVAARAWLSKRWAALNLTPLPRGPKNSKK